MANNTTAPVFGYPAFGPNGSKTLTQLAGDTAGMLQNITIYRLAPGQEKTFLAPGEETAVVLVEGAVSLSWPGGRCEAVRHSFIYDGAYCLHTPAGMEVTVCARENSELLVQSTPNPTAFEPHLYTPENCPPQYFGEGEWEGKALRTVRTFFDYHSAPYSNMVCGEIVVPQGGWSSYPPHHHPQPEVYYYRFEKPQGFGACFIGDGAHVIRDGSFAAIPGGLCHPQVNAPGYPMYYVWMIRHLDGNPWTDRIYAPEHQWLAGK